MICRLYLRIMMKGVLVRKQIQQILLYVQRVLADMQKKNLLKDLESEKIEFKLTEEFLMKLKRKFGGEDEELVKVTKLKKVEQREKTIEEFVQKFKRAANKSEYKVRVLVKEFKRKMNSVIKRKLMETERSLTSIEQWYKYVTNLNRYWRKSQKKN